MALEPLYVIDTNALIWHLVNQRKLSPRAREIFAAAERGDTRLVVSSVVIAELYYADKKYGLFSDFRALFQRLLNTPHYRLVPFNARHVLDSDADAAVPEMHDRIIAGLARRLGAPLITSDPEIASTAFVTVVW